MQLNLDKKADHNELLIHTKDLNTNSFDNDWEGATER